jgi:hypothetical protein
MAVCIRNFSQYEFKLDEDDKLVCCNTRTGKTVKGSVGKRGYARYWLYGDDGRKQCLRRSRLTLLLYGPEQPSPEHTCDHINRIRDDDKISNLRWLSVAEQNINQNFRGKGYHKNKGKWRVVFNYKYIGIYNTVEEAQSKVNELRASHRLRD